MIIDRQKAKEPESHTERARIFKSWFVQVGSSQLIDDLTHLFNRRYLFHRLIQEIERARRLKTSLTVVLLDVDNFKEINQSYGFYQGDQILGTIARLLGDNSRKSDIVGRYGADTFALILPDTDLDGAKVVVRRLQEKVRKYKFKTVLPEKVHLTHNSDREGLSDLTVSAGIKVYGDEDSASNLFQQCREGLRSAKKKGLKGAIECITKDQYQARVLNFDLFVGRTQYMNRLETILNEALNRKGGVIFITGETGIGKTKIMLELAGRARSLGFTILYGKAQSVSSYIPYQPFINAIRFYLQEQQLSNGERISQIFGAYAPQLAQFVPEVARFVPAEYKAILPEHEKQRLFEGIARFFISLTQSDPLLLLLDDLQWAGESDMSLIHFLARAISQERILITGAIRMDEARFLSMQFKEKFNEIVKEGVGQEMALEVLSREESDQLIAGLLNNFRLPIGFSDLVYSLSRGNPLHIIELIKYLIDQDLLSLVDQEWVIKDGDYLDSVKNLGSIVEKRISRLDGLTDNALSCASVLGESFNFEVVQRVTGLNEGHLVEILDRAIEDRLIVELPGSVFSNFIFTHSFIQNKFYERLGEARLRHYHRQIAYALEKVYSGHLDEIYGELSWHYAESGDTVKALEYSIKAAQSMQGVFASPEAIGYYRMAARICDKYGVGTDAEKIAIYEGMGDVYMIVGDLTQAIDNYNLLVSGQVVDLPFPVKARLWLKIGRVHQKQGQYSEALTCYNLSHTFINEEHDLDLYYQIKVATAGVLYQKGQFNDALSELKPVMELGGNDKEYIAEAYTVAGAVQTRLSNFDQAIEYYNKAMRVWERLGILFGIARTNNNIGTVWFMQGDMEKALKYFELSLDFYERIGDILDKGTLLNNLGSICFNLAQWAKAFDHFTAALRIMDRIGNRHAMSNILINLSSVLIKQGSLERAREFLERGMKLAEEIGDFYVLGIGYINLSQILFEQNNLSLTLEYLNRVESITRKVELFDLYCYERLERARIYLARGEIAETGKLVSDLLNEKDRPVNKRLFAELLLVQGQIHLKAGEVEKAGEVAMAVIDLTKKINDRYLYARALHLQGLGPGREEERIRILSEARKIFKELGAVLDLKRIEEDLKSKKD